MLKSKNKKRKISAILSTRNSERFMSGCLDNLLRQTVADDLEIIVINSASDENEEEIVLRYMKKYGNIKYYKTSKAEGLYASWNRAIKMASGKYIVNTNADDRSRPDAFKIMAQALDDNPEIALVYSDYYVTNVPNDKTGSMKTKKRHWKTRRLGDYSVKALLLDCICGPRPMWRRKIHNKIGFFNESFVVAGDYEFWLRISESYPMMHLRDRLCLYYFEKNCLSLKLRQTARKENIKIRLKYLGLQSA